MSKQYLDWRNLTDRITDKVQEYLDEINLWNGNTVLWTDGASGTVTLDDEGGVHPGEGRPVSEFFVHGEDGAPEPDIDAIEDFASGWFDLRRAD